MSQQWYISRQGERYGPYSWEQMRGFAQSGQVVSQDLVWSEVNRKRELLSMALGIQGYAKEPPE